MGRRRLVIRPREGHNQRYAPQQRLQAVQQQMRAHERGSGTPSRTASTLSSPPTSSTAFLMAGASKPLDIDYLAECIGRSRRQRLFHIHLIRKEVLQMSTASANTSISARR